MALLHLPPGPQHWGRWGSCVLLHAVLSVLLCTSTDSVFLPHGGPAGTGSGFTTSSSAVEVTPEQMSDRAAGTLLSFPSQHSLSPRPWTPDSVAHGVEERVADRSSWLRVGDIWAQNLCGLTLRCDSLVRG